MSSSCSSSEVAEAAAVTPPVTPPAGNVGCEDWRGHPLGPDSTEGEGDELDPELRDYEPNVRFTEITYWNQEIPQEGQIRYCCSDLSQKADG